MRAFVAFATSSISLSPMHLTTNSQHLSSLRLSGDLFWKKADAWSVRLRESVVSSNLSVTLLVRMVSMISGMIVRLCMIFKYGS